MSVNTIESLVQDSATRRLEHATLDFASGTDRQMASRGSRNSIPTRQSMCIRDRLARQWVSNTADGGYPLQDMDMLSTGESALEWSQWTAEMGEISS